MVQQAKISTQTNPRRQLNKRSNALYLKISGGPFRMYSLLKHQGRKSGREYQRPVSAFPLGDGLVLALLYAEASQVDWCPNVMAAGYAILKTRGVEYRLEKPEIVAADEAWAAFPLITRWLYRAEGITEFMWLRHPARSTR